MIERRLKKIAFFIGFQNSFDLIYLLFNNKYRL